MSKFKAGNKAFIVESSIFVKEVYVIKSSGGFCLIRYTKGDSGYRVRESRLFATEEEAKVFIGKEVKKASDDLGLLAYVDGSFNIKTKEYGYGCVLIEGQQVIKQLLGKGNQPDYASMRNVSGEILGCLKAIQYAIDHHYESICIYYDYEGIEKWATGLWKANKEQTQNYVKTIQEMKKEIDIYFQKVLAHSGDYYNEVADSLAKKAVGIKK